MDDPHRPPPGLAGSVPNKKVIQLSGYTDNDIRYCQLLFDDYHRFELVGRIAGQAPPVRSGKAKMPRLEAGGGVSPSELRVDIQAILDGPGGNELPTMIAPYVVWRVKPYSTVPIGPSVHPAATLRWLNKDFKAAIDAEIKEWLRECGRLFDRAQYPLYWLSRGNGGGPGGMSPPSFSEFNSIADEAEREQRKKAAMERWFECKLVVEEFKQHMELNAHPDTLQRLIKEMPLSLWDRGSGAGPEFAGGPLTADNFPKVNLNFSSVHLYFNLGGNAARCSICSPLGKRCESKCQPRFTRLLEIHGRSNIVLCGSACLEPLTVKFDHRSTEPLAVIEGEHTKQQRDNAQLLKCMLRRKGVGMPFTGPRIRTLVGGGTYDAFFGGIGVRFAPAVSRGEAEVRSALQRARAPTPPIILLEHPAIGKGTMPLCKSFQELLGIGPYELSMAKKDSDAETALREDVAMYEFRKREEKMRHDFIVLCTQGTADPSCFTLSDLDAWFPGVQATLELAMDQTDRTGSYMHILDIGIANELCEAVRMMLGALARHDSSLSASRASGHAYAWYTGMHLGRAPGTTLSDISTRINIDLALADRDGGAGLQEWEVAVTGLHAFSAVNWENMGVRVKSDRGGAAAARSSDPIAGKFEWYVDIGGEEVCGPYQPSFQRDSYARMRQRGRALMSALGWEVPWPKVPSFAEIAEAKNYADRYMSANDAPTDVLDFVTVVAKQLCCFQATRGIGLDVLTGNDSRSFSQAAYLSGLRADSLAVMVAAMPSKDEPDDPVPDAPPVSASGAGPSSANE